MDRDKFATGSSRCCLRSLLGLILLCWHHASYWLRHFADLEEPKDAIVLDISRTNDQLLEDFRFQAGAGVA